MMLIILQIDSICGIGLEGNVIIMGKQRGISAIIAINLSVVASLIFLALTACGQTSVPADSVVEAPSTRKNAGEKITLNWYVHYSWFTTNWGDDTVAKTITDETGVSINFVTPTGNEREKLDALMSSGSLPDLITLGFWELQAERMINEGLVYPLNELADAYDPYFWEVAHPQRLSWYTREDGNIYAYPNSSYAPSDYEEHGNIGSNQAFLVRSDIYKAIGSPDMTTPEGFKQAIRDAFEKFPTVSGGKPLLAIGLYDFNTEGCNSLDEIL
jgi:putative aldouronate transport system substrate-binding protein